MIVTAVERLRKRRGRVEVYLDGVAAFEIAAATAEKSGLRPGRQVDQAGIEAIVASEQRRRAMETAAAMLARRPRSEREVRRRLAQRKFEPALIDETVTRLCDARLLDDAEFARTWTESRDRISPRGQRLIERELRAAGVDGAIAAEAVEVVSDEDAAYRLASRRVRSLSSLEYDAFRSRMASFLQRRGFGWETVRLTVERCWRESGGESSDDLDQGIG
jgi:regulatory protein